MFLLKYIFPFFANEVHFTDPKKFFQFLLKKNIINDSRVVNYNRRVFKILVTGVKR